MRDELIKLGVIFGAGAFAVSCSSPARLEVFPILEQQCAADSSSVARHVLTLRPNQSVVVGSGELFRHGNVLTLTNYGSLVNDTGRLGSEPPAELLPDGRLGLTVVRGTIFDKNPKVGLRVDEQNGSKRLTFAMNCSDRSVYPPEDR